MSIKFFKISILLLMINIFNIYSAEVSPNVTNPLEISNAIKPEPLNIENQPSNNDMNTNTEYKNKLIDERLTIKRNYYNKQSLFILKCIKKYRSKSLINRFFSVLGSTILLLGLLVSGSIVNIQNINKAQDKSRFLIILIFLIIFYVVLIVFLIFCIYKDISPIVIILYNWKIFLTILSSLLFCNLPIFF